jgi:hypothetical protein
LSPESSIAGKNSLVSDYIKNGSVGAAIEMLDAFVEDDRVRHEDLQKLLEKLQPEIRHHGEKKDRS